MLLEYLERTLRIFCALNLAWRRFMLGRSLLTPDQIHLLQRKNNFIWRESGFFECKKICISLLYSKGPHYHWRYAKLLRQKTDERIRFIIIMLQHTTAWFQWMLDITLTDWLPALFSWFSPIWLPSVPQHEKAIHWKPVSQCW